MGNVLFVRESRRLAGYETDGLGGRLRFHLRRVAEHILPAPRVPSSEEKRARILEIAKRLQCNTFVETGTFVGDTVAYMLGHFRSIISIELSPELARRAQRRFLQEPSVRILEGNSSEVLGSVMQTLGERAFFWLDGHYSYTCDVEGERIETARGPEDTPVLKELAALLGDSAYDHVIVIDDARHFTGKGAYPTRRAISRLVQSYDRGYKVSVEDDMIILVPRSAIQNGE
jgi:hypothetical protein